MDFSWDGSARWSRQWLLSNGRKAEAADLEMDRTTAMRDELMIRDKGRRGVVDLAFGWLYFVSMFRKRNWGHPHLYRSGRDKRRAGESV
jgi:hypothetical protein